MKLSALVVVVGRSRRCAEEENTIHSGKLDKHPVQTAELEIHELLNEVQRKHAYIYSQETTTRAAW
jgi:hypothetical protein